MAKRKKTPWNSHIRRTYPGQGFYESNAAYRKRKKREKQINSFLKKTEKSIDKLTKPKPKAQFTNTRQLSYTNTDKFIREQERAKLREEAKAEYSKFQEQISTLSNVLLEREKEEFDWKAISSPRGQYQKQKFQSSSPFIPPEEPTEQNIKSDIIAENSRIFVAILILVFGIVGFFFKFWIGLLGIVSAVIFFLTDLRRLDKICESKLPKALQSATDKYQKELQAENLKYQLKSEQERIAHEEQEAEMQKCWEEEEEARKRIRESVSNEDLEILENLLIEELCKLTFPFDQEIALCFNRINSIDLEFRLPALDVVPDEDLSLTKTEKLSRKAMTQKKRLEIFTDLCTGIALRLAYESFRIFEFLDEAHIFGYCQSIDITTGHEEEIFPLFLEVDRTQLSELNLDQIDPSTAFNHVGGIFQCDRRGTLSHISFVE